MKTDNNESWFLYQIFDNVSARYTPVFCAATKRAALYDCEDLIKRQVNRPFVMIPLGVITGGVFVESDDDSVQFGEMLHIDDAIQSNGYTPNKVTVP